MQAKICSSREHKLLWEFPLLLSCWRSKSLEAFQCKSTNKICTYHWRKSHSSHVLSISCACFLKRLLRNLVKGQGRVRKIIYSLRSMSCCESQGATVCWRLYLHGASRTAQFTQARFKCLSVCACPKQKINGVLRTGWPTLRWANGVTRSSGWKQNLEQKRKVGKMMQFIIMSAVNQWNTT